MLPDNYRKAFWLACWAAFLVILSQLPYRLVWAGQATFPYDAYTIFSPWNVARLAALREGVGPLGFFHVGTPFEIWPSYFFTGIVRQLAAVAQSNTPAGHAVVQALHLALVIPVAALLFHSCGVRLRYGLVGATVFALSGIHVSLSQHVYAHEALLYLVASFLMLRLVVVGWNSRRRDANAAVWLLCAIALISLVRVHHEAVLYVAPLGVWALAQLVQIHRRGEGTVALRNAAVRLAALAVVIVVCSVPMLLTAHDLSVTNKTQPYTYTDLRPYFADARVFMLGLVLPGFTGKVDSAYPFAYGFGQDSTLAYIFAGSFTPALFAVAIAAFVRSRHWGAAAFLSMALIILLAYTYGPGNFVHRGISFALPFLTQIGHSYYGLHVLYLVTAFGLSVGLAEVVERRGRLEFVILHLSVVAFIFYMALRAHVQGGWGLTGSLFDFASFLQDDTRWLANVSLVAFALIAGATWVGGWAPRRPQLLSAFPAVLLVSFGALIAADMVRPLARAHFVPNGGSRLMQADPIGGFNLSRDIEAYFRKQPLSDNDSPRRILPLFQKAGGWRSNALLPHGVVLVHQPADSGGNRYIARLLDREPDSSVIDSFIDDYGVTDFWVARWEMDTWQRALAASPRLRLVFRSEYGGDVYAVIPDARGVRSFHWHAIQPKISQGVVQRRWQFETLPPGPRPLSLPLMWHPAYEVRDASGARLDFRADPMGRMMLLERGRPSTPLTVAYPSTGLAWLTAIAALLYLALVAALLALGVRWVRTRREQHLSRPGQ